MPPICSGVLGLLRTNEITLIIALWCFWKMFLGSFILSESIH